MGPFKGGAGREGGLGQTARHRTNPHQDLRRRVRPANTHTCPTTLVQQSDRNNYTFDLCHIKSIVTEMNTHIYFLGALDNNFAYMKAA